MSKYVYVGVLSNVVSLDGSCELFLPNEKKLTLNNDMAIKEITRIVKENFGNSGRSYMISKCAIDMLSNDIDFAHIISKQYDDRGNCIDIEFNEPDGDLLPIFIAGNTK